ncbi:MAG: hypothetical protein WBD47_11795 [Phormidesmis sp.]
MNEKILMQSANAGYGYSAALSDRIKAGLLEMSQSSFNPVANFV